MTAARILTAENITVIQEGLTMTDAAANAQTKRDENFVAASVTRISHEGHAHPATKAGRAACRRGAAPKTLQGHVTVQVGKNENIYVAFSKAGVVTYTNKAGVEKVATPKVAATFLAN